VSCRERKGRRAKSLTNHSAQKGEKKGSDSAVFLLFSLVKKKGRKKREKAIRAYRSSFLSCSYLVGREKEKKKKGRRAGHNRPCTLLSEDACYGGRKGRKKKGRGNPRARRFVVEGWRADGKGEGREAGTGDP